VGDQLDGAGPPAAALKAQLAELELPVSFVTPAMMVRWCVERYYANAAT
jgi:hypothetical protein